MTASCMFSSALARSLAKGVLYTVGFFIYNMTFYDVIHATSVSEQILVNVRYIVTCVTSTTAEYIYGCYAYKTMQKGDPLLHDHSYFDECASSYMSVPQHSWIKE